MFKGDVEHWHLIVWGVYDVVQDQKIISWISDLLQTLAIVFDDLALVSGFGKAAII